MKKSIMAILLIAVVGLLVVGCADPNGGGTTGGGGTGGSQVGDSLLLTFDRVLDDNEKASVENVFTQKFSSIQPSVKPMVTLNKRQVSNNTIMAFGEWTIVENKSVYTIFQAIITTIGIDLEGVKTFVESSEFINELQKVDDSITPPIVTENTTDTDVESESCTIEFFLQASTGTVPFSESQLSDIKETLTYNWFDWGTGANAHIVTFLEIDVTNAGFESLNAFWLDYKGTLGNQVTSLGYESVVVTSDGTKLTITCTPTWYNHTIEFDYTQWVIDGETYTATHYREDNVKESESVYIFEVATDFLGDIFVEYWDDVSENFKYSTTSLNTEGYTVYKGTQTKSSSLDSDGNWTETWYDPVHYFLLKQDVTSLQIVELYEISDANYAGDYYISSDENSNLGEIMVEHSFAGNNGTYGEQFTQTWKMSFTDNTYVFQVVYNYGTERFAELSLETISTSPTVYCSDEVESDQTGEWENIYGNTSVDTEGYTLYNVTYRRALSLNERGVWEELPLQESDLGEPLFLMYKIEKDNLYFVNISLSDGKYYTSKHHYTGDINNPVLKPEVYIKQ